MWSSYHLRQCNDSEVSYIDEGYYLNGEFHKEEDSHSVQAMWP